MSFSIFRNRFFKRVWVVVFILLLLLASLGWWLPRYLILEDGANLESQPQTLFGCLLNPVMWNTKTSVDSDKLVVGSTIDFFIEIYPKGVVTEIMDNEFIELTSNAYGVLAFSIDEEDETSWLNITIEQDLGLNPFHRIISNWQRREKEQQLQQLLKYISKQEDIGFCTNN